MLIGCGRHWPGAAAWLHDSQPPVHAPSQQTPSTQLPEVHWFAAVHITPLACFGLQLPDAPPVQ